jgi:hypothetical protein
VDYLAQVTVQSNRLWYGELDMFTMLPAARNSTAEHMMP